MMRRLWSVAFVSVLGACGVETVSFRTEVDSGSIPRGGGEVVGTGGVIVFSGGAFGVGGSVTGGVVGGGFGGGGSEP